MHFKAVWPQSSDDRFFSFSPSDILAYPNGSIGAVSLTVIVAHVIIGLYIWVAIKEEETPQQIKED